MRRGKNCGPCVCLPIHCHHFQGHPQVASKKPAYWRVFSKNTLAPRSLCSLLHAIHCKRVHELEKAKLFGFSCHLGQIHLASIGNCWLLWPNQHCYLVWSLWRHDNFLSILADILEKDVIRDVVNRDIYPVPMNEVRLGQWYSFRTLSRYGAENDYVQLTDKLHKGLGFALCLLEVRML